MIQNVFLVMTVDPNILVRHEGANYQRVKVPSGKLSVHPGSYPGIEVGRPPW